MFDRITVFGRKFRFYELMINTKEILSFQQESNSRFNDIHKCETTLNLFPDSSVGIALGYGLDDRGSRIRLPAGAGNFSLHHRIQNGSGAHPASYPMGTRGSFPEVKAAGA
jgi:hypothetical protein